MAKPAAKADKPELAADPRPVPQKSASPMAFVAAMVVLTGIAVGFGGLMGLQLVGRMEKPAETEPAPPKASTANAGAGLNDRYAGNVNLRPLAPIVTNHANPDKTWIRLEALLVMEGEQTPDASTLSAQIVEDIVAFLRTVSLTQIQGASGFQHLREDLNDRVRVRSGGKVRDVVVQSMIIE
jgi:flagellar FliL protein